MIYVIHNKQDSRTNKTVKDFFNKRNIEFKWIKGKKLSPKKREEIIFLDETTLLEEFFNRDLIKKCKNKEINVDDFDKLLRDEKYLSSFWFVDDEAKKTCGKVAEIDKMIPKEHRQAEVRKLIDQEGRYYEGNHEKYGILGYYQ